MVEKMLGKKRIIGKYEKKCAYPALIGSPGRWTGNKVIFKGGLIVKTGLVSVIKMAANVTIET